MPLIEAGLSLSLLLLGVGLNLEMIHRAQYEVLLRHSAFLYVRSRALGEGVAPSRRRVFEFLERALGYRKTRSVFIGLHLGEKQTSRGLEASAHYRFPSLFRFNYGRHLSDGRIQSQNKHHFEVTRQCRFYF